VEVAADALQLAHLLGSQVLVLPAPHEPRPREEHRALLAVALAGRALHALDEARAYVILGV